MFHNSKPLLPIQNSDLPHTVFVVVLLCCKFQPNRLSKILFMKISIFEIQVRVHVRVRVRVRVRGREKPDSRHFTMKNLSNRSKSRAYKGFRTWRVDWRYRQCRRKSQTGWKPVRLLQLCCHCDICERHMRAVSLNTCPYTFSHMASRLALSTMS